MKKLSCKFQYFSDRFTYKLPNSTEVVETGGVGTEQEKTLIDTLREANEAIKNADVKLKKIEEFYKFTRPTEADLQKGDKFKLASSKNINPDVQKTYLDFLGKWYQLKKTVAEGMKYKGKGKEKVQTDQDIMDKTISELEELLSGFREKQQLDEEKNEQAAAGDPLAGFNEKLTLDSNPLVTPKPKEQKSEAKAKSSGDEPKDKTDVLIDEKEPAKDTQEYWMFQLGHVVRKINAGSKEPMTADEKKAVMFFCNPGKSRSFMYHENGKSTSVTLQRDTTGKYLRILGGESSGYAAFSLSDEAPVWPGETNPEKGAIAPAEKFGKNFSQDLAWLKSPKAPIGSQISVNINLIHEKKGDTESFKKLWLEVIKGVDGHYRVTTKEQWVTKNGKLVVGQKPEHPTSRDFMSLTDAEEYAKSHFTAETTFTRIEGTSDDLEAEKLYVAEQRSKTLEKYSGMIVRSFVPIFMKDIMDQNLTELSKYLNQFGIRDWESKDAFIGKYIVRVKDGVIQIVDLQPGGVGSPKGKNNEAVAFQKKVNYGGTEEKMA